ncbi:hypothetical protein STEG23_004365, partial [Scotinomys teguina]
MFCGLPVTSTSCLHGGLASFLCCLALDSSSSFPCPAFRAIAKSLLLGYAMEWKYRPLVTTEVKVEENQLKDMGLLGPPGPMTSGVLLGPLVPISSGYLCPPGPMVSRCSWVPGGDSGSSQVEI